MNETQVIQVAAGAMLTGAKVAAPIVVASMVVGLLVSLFQSVTQIQESTLTFVPKLLAVALVLALTGHWMIATMTNYVDQLFASVPALLAGS